jgi:hypothetical protein
MTVKGSSASNNGDRLSIDVVDPAFPQSIARLGLQGGMEAETGLGQGDLLIREGFQVEGQSAAESVSTDRFVTTGRPPNRRLYRPPKAAPPPVSMLRAIILGSGENHDYERGQAEDLTRAQQVCGEGMARRNQGDDRHHGQEEGSGHQDRNKGMKTHASHS